MELFFDVEMLTTKTHENLALQVAVVNKYKKLVLHSYVKWEEKDICKMQTAIHGITKEKMQIGQPFDIVRLNTLFLKLYIVLKQNYFSPQ